MKTTDHGQQTTGDTDIQDGAPGVARPTDGERRTFRLPPVDGTPAEKRSFRQIEGANQAHIELEATVRRLARVGSERPGGSGAW